MTPAIRAVVLTISDGVVAGSRDDASGPLLREWLEQRGANVVCDVVTDDSGAIVSALLRHASGEHAVDLIVTTGGTGLTERDVTPEATRAVIERDAPGIAEHLRARGQSSTPYAALSRGLAGVRGRTLIVNLPGSTGGARDGAAALDPLLDHAVQLLRGRNTDQHPAPDA